MVYVLIRENKLTVIKLPDSANFSLIGLGKNSIQDFSIPKNVNIYKLWISNNPLSKKTLNGLAEYKNEHKNSYVLTE